MPMMLLAAGTERNFFEWVLFYITKYWPMFLDGTAITLLLSLTGTIFGFVIGLAVGVVRTIPENPRRHPLLKLLQKIVNLLLAVYIEVFRGTPMMVQAMVIYYAIPAATGAFLPAIPAGIFVISVNTGAYLAEIVRGGIISIDKGQFEAAQSLGMTHTQTMINIVLPQAVRNILPALGNEFVINIKDSSVLNVISVSELYFNSLGITGMAFRFFEVFAITAIIYFICTFTVTRILRVIEKKLDGPDSFQIHGSQTVPEIELKLRRGHFGKGM